MLVRLLYASRAVDAGPEAIESILAQSREFNPANGITGVLCYGNGVFLIRPDGYVGWAGSTVDGLMQYAAAVGASAD